MRTVTKVALLAFACLLLAASAASQCTESCATCSSDAECCQRNVDGSAGRNCQCRKLHIQAVNTGAPRAVCLCEGATTETCIYANYVKMMAREAPKIAARAAAKQAAAAAAAGAQGGRRLAQ
ncbi:hypothetical protein OEZ86_001158 [Tetradesmus obliquus]|uniref:Uncharacterized protein n=1 Tax=Tetradesmus obliquus TaxID=3088 RepID=A0A383VRN2_TETOB|nr:hypothetical protein OEZ86_001158 [Tetradesmus obliquus]|eukprot:jgi/Sobl393_1/14507/SZX68177.1